MYVYIWKLCQSLPYLKLTYSSSAHFELVEYLDVSEDLNSKHSLNDLVYTQIHTLYFDHQRQVQINLYVLLDIGQGMNMVSSP